MLAKGAEWGRESPILDIDTSAFQIDGDGLAPPLPLVVLLHCVEEEVVARHIPIDEAAQSRRKNDEKTEVRKISPEIFPTLVSEQRGLTLSLRHPTCLDSH